MIIATGAATSAVKPAAMKWDATFDWKKLRVGYIKTAFDAPTMAELKAPTAGGDAVMEAYRRRVARMEWQRSRSAYDLNAGLLDMSGNTLSIGWGSALVTGVVSR